MLPMIFRLSGYWLLPLGYTPNPWIFGASSTPSSMAGRSLS